MDYPTEHDLFSFVFFPERVKEEKIKFIFSGKYDCVIGFYKNLKNYLSSVDITPDIKCKLALAIPIYTTAK